MKRISFYLLLFSLSIGTSLGAGAVPNQCYFNDFRHSTYPWKESECLNYEEVFKNFQFYESTLDQKSRTLTVKFYKQGQVVEIKKYQIQENQKLKELKN